MSDLNLQLFSDNENAEAESLFDSIKHVNDVGQEFWYARELSKILNYKDFRNFESTIYKAMEACKNSGNEISDHFGEATEMLPIGSGANRTFPSYVLSRYACYLIVMNGDPNKNIIALALYVISVRRTRDLLTASFRFHLTMDTLAVQLYTSHYPGVFGTYTR